MNLNSIYKSMTGKIAGQIYLQEEIRKYTNETAKFSDSDLYWSRKALKDHDQRMIFNNWIYLSSIIGNFFLHQNTVSYKTEAKIYKSFLAVDYIIHNIQEIETRKKIKLLSSLLLEAQVAMEEYYFFYDLIEVITESAGMKYKGHEEKDSLENLLGRLNDLIDFVQYDKIEFYRVDKEELKRNVENLLFDYNDTKLQKIIEEFYKHKQLGIQRRLYDWEIEELNKQKKNGQKRNNKTAK